MNCEFKTYSVETPMTREMFSQVFEIMEYSFPPCERRDFEEQFSEFQRPLFRSLTAQTDDSRILGFMNYWELADFVYLEHFAVARELRRHGIGGRLMEQLHIQTNEMRVILEAEPPEQSDYAARRIVFYRNLGFFPNDYEYFQPPYREGEIPVRLILLSQGKPLTQPEFIRVRDMLYSDAYETSADFLQSL